MTELEKLQAENANLREQVTTLTDVVERQVTYINELRKLAKLAPHDYEPARPGTADVD